MKTYTQEELTEIIENHKLWIIGDGGARADLYGANLYGANLSRADLYGADLSRANLSGADLSRADLYGANLSGANLSGANLSRANLSGANLSGANLSGADLNDCSLRGASGEMDKVKSIFLEEYQVTYTSEVMQIGCQRHKIDEWWGFDDERIAKMDGKRALKFWRKYKDFIKMAIELSPANPTKEMK